MKAAQRLILMLLVTGRCLFLCDFCMGADVETSQLLIPVMVNRPYNPVLNIYIKGSGVLNGLTLKTEGNCISKIYLAKGGKKGKPDPENLAAIQLVEKNDNHIQYTCNEKLKKKKNVFHVMVSIKPGARLTEKLNVSCSSVIIDNKKVVPKIFKTVKGGLRLGYRLRHKGDDNSKGYRIPGMTTTDKGTLLAVYDIRRDGNRDLQGDIDIGLSRSIDKGQTWEPMRIVLDMGAYGGLPQKYNGVSDAGILFDSQTKRIFVFGCWMHGLRDKKTGKMLPDLTNKSKAWSHQWHRGKAGSGPGMTPEETCQFIMTYSDDDGKTWSKPESINKQIKDPKWFLAVPAPGNGITLSDGTLIMPVQGRNENDMQFSTIMHSENHGKTWKYGKPARLNTTECNAVELSDGSVMLSMRDNRNRKDKSDKNGRAVSITKDLGQTWIKHSADHRADLLPEPTCMASLIRMDVPVNHKVTPVLFFSNPNNRKLRKNMTIKVSFDDGRTWPKKHWVELDEIKGAYSSLAPVGNYAVGIEYESSQGYIIYQVVTLKELFGE